MYCSFISYNTAILKSTFKIKTDPIYFRNTHSWSYCTQIITAHYSKGKKKIVCVNFHQNVIIWLSEKDYTNGD